MLDAHLHADEGTGFSAVPDVTFFLNSTSPYDWNRVGMLAAQNPAIVPFFGLHPWFTAGVSGDGWEKKLACIVGEHRCGIGEIGLDPLKGAPIERQKEIFTRQVSLACDTGKPFVLHCVRAWGDTMKILHDAQSRKLPLFMAHSFGGSFEIQQELVRMGGYISFSLKDVERRGEKMRPLMVAVPEDRLLLETDYPQCGEGTYRACLERLYERSALLMGSDTKIVKRMVAANGTVFTHPATARRG